MAAFISRQPALTRIIVFRVVVIGQGTDDHPYSVIAITVVVIIIMGGPLQNYRRPGDLNFAKLLVPPAGHG